ncbi:MAG: bifunctional riboflavin kinase/FAD synthetase [Verrucomicrobiales bacterium]|nr:bifunctional riboflavin kinase/FAD synthetase [Verrucomicrobiales bacterium]
MRVLQAPNELSDRPVAIAIGVFDGVHLGHQQVLSHALSDARESNGISLAVTFDKHPSQIVAPARAPRLIYSLSQKLLEIERCGIGATWVIPFDQAFSQISARNFVRLLAMDLQPLKSISVGESFTFGHKRLGNIQLLNAMADEFGFEVNPVPAVYSTGSVISSSRIRNAIAAGQLSEASLLLGRPYAIMGNVLRGEQLGRKLNFPTANIDVSGLVLPPTGVYAVTTSIEGKKVVGAANLGYRPSIPNAPHDISFEVHLLDWTGDLYGKELQFIINRKIRDEMKFQSLEDLKKQIALDIKKVRE